MCEGQNTNDLESRSLECFLAAKADLILDSKQATLLDLYNLIEQDEFEVEEIGSVINQLDHFFQRLFATAIVVLGHFGTHTHPLTAAASRHTQIKLCPPSAFKLCPHSSG